MNRKGITIQVDIASRELPYLKKLKILMEDKYDVDVRLVPQDPIWSSGKSSFFREARQNTDILITPSYNSKRTLNTLAWKYLSGAKLVHWHSEQLIDKRFYDEKLNQNCVELYNRDIDYHLVWGADFYNKLINIAKTKKENIFVTGCPKLDLIEYEVCKYREDTKRVLFVCDFLWATMSGVEYKSTLDRYGYSEEDDFRGFYTTAYKKFIGVVEGFAKTNPNYYVVVRPHPGEPKTAYEDLLKYKNISLDIGTPFIESAKSANLIVQFLSTSFFESSMLHKPVICLDLVDSWGTHYRDYFKYYNFVSVGDFQSYAAECLEGGEILRCNQLPLNELFSNDKGESIPRVAEALDNILEKSKTKNVWLLRDRWRIYRFLLMHTLKNIFGVFSYALYSFGVKIPLFKRVILAEQKWLNSPDYFDDKNITK